MSDDFVSLVTRIEKPIELSLKGFTPLVVHLMVAGAKSKGFVSSEITPPQNSAHLEWCLTQRFNNRENLEAWQSSPERKAIFADFETSQNAKSTKVSEEVSSGDPIDEVATVIFTDLKPGMEDQYFDWELKMQSTQAAFPGYLGTHIRPPSQDQPARWATLIRFRSSEDLERWFTSPERAQLVDEKQQFVIGTQIQKVDSAFPGWFAVDAKGKSPPNWKTAQLVLLGIFPIVMLQIKYCNPLYTSLNQLSPAIGMLLNMMMSCTLVAWVTMPFFIKVFRFWLYPDKRTTKVDLLGELTVLGVLSTEMGLLWRLL